MVKNCRNIVRKMIPWNICQKCWTHFVTFFYAFLLLEKPCSLVRPSAFLPPSNANAHMRACALDFGSHGLSARRARRTKSRRPEGPKGGPKGHRLEVGARRAPKLLVIIYRIIIPGNMAMQVVLPRSIVSILMEVVPSGG